MKQGHLGRLFALDSTSESDVVPLLQVPSANERATLFLRAIYGSRDFTQGELAEARNRILDAIATDIAKKCEIAAPSEEDADDIVGTSSSRLLEAEFAPLPARLPHFRIGRTDVEFAMPAESCLESDFISEIDPAQDFFEIEPAQGASRHSWFRNSTWTAQRFWAGGAAVGLLAACFIVIFGPSIWQSVKERGHLAAPGTTQVAEVNTEQKTLTRSPERPPKLVMSPTKPQPQGQPSPLGVSLRNDAGPGSVVVLGLPSGSVLSAGEPVGDQGWRVATEDLSSVRLTPPPGFIGAIDLLVEFRRADDTTADRKQLRLEWVQSKAH